MKNIFELANMSLSDDFDQLFDEIFEEVKKDPEWLSNVVQQYVFNVTQEVFDVKQTVKFFNNPALLEEEFDENEEDSN